MRGSPQREVLSEPPPQKSHYRATWFVERWPQRQKKQKNESKSGNVAPEFADNRTVVGQAVTNVLVAEVGVVFVVSAEVSIIRGCGAEEDGRRQVVFPGFEVLVHLPWDTGLDGHSVSLKTSLSTAGNQNFIFVFVSKWLLTNLEMLDLLANFQHPARGLVSQHHWTLDHKPSNPAMLPVVDI